MTTDVHQDDEDPDGSTSQVWATLPAAFLHDKLLLMKE
jgi:hypothetical protein